MVPFQFCGIFCCGTDSLLTDREPSNYRLKKGDFIMFDVGCVFKHYYSDIGRTLVFGEPSSKQIKYYQAIKEGRTMALNILKLGVKAKEIFEVAVKSIRNCGISHYRRHHVGHSTG
ncbi:MAG: aminopeptidase P family protein [Parcubacteria group bacterium]|nr:aminopeptidase P family protein [Parcubacteria group bacterium]